MIRTKKEKPRQNCFSTLIIPKNRKKVNNMKNLKTILVIIIALVVVYLMATAYVNRIEKIENGELVQVSESYMK